MPRPGRVGRQRTGRRTGRHATRTGVRRPKRRPRQCQSLASPSLAQSSSTKVAVVCVPKNPFGTSLPAVKVTASPFLRILETRGACPSASETWSRSRPSGSRAALRTSAVFQPGPCQKTSAPLASRMSELPSGPMYFIATISGLHHSGGCPALHGGGTAHAAQANITIAATCACLMRTLRPVRRHGDARAAEVRSEAVLSTAVRAAHLDTQTTRRRVSASQATSGCWQRFSRIDVCCKRSQDTDRETNDQRNDLPTTVRHESPTSEPMGCV